MSILVLSGLPASGKTTEALAWVAESPTDRLRVNWDDIRVELFGNKGASYFTGKNVRDKESRVKAESLARAEYHLEKGGSLVIDNTNLTERARSMWVELGKRYGVEVIQHDIDTRPAECIRRDKLRIGDDRVGRAVIDRMALTTGWIDWDLPIYARKFVIVDIDGTLSDPTHRLHHIRGPVIPSYADLHKQECVKKCFENGHCPECGIDYPVFKPRWDLFHAEVDQDGPKPVIINLVKHLAYTHSIIVVSGRSPEHGCGIKTEDWLDKHLGNAYYRHLFMRAAGDYKPDYEHKQEILDLLPLDRIAFTIDDRAQVVSMWRKNGLTCLQVAEGNF